MRHALFCTTATKLNIAILLKDASFIVPAINEHYIQLLVKKGISHDSLIAFTLEYNGAKKAKADQMKGYLAKLLPEIIRLGITTLYVADAEYFKTLTKSKKADPFYGYVLPCAIDGYDHLKVILGVNYQAIAYNPNLKEKLSFSLDTLVQHVSGDYVDPGKEIIHYENYPSSIADIAAALQELHKYPELTLDIEGFSLKFYKCGIGSISFAWSQHEGIGFLVDYEPIEPTEIQVWDTKDKKYKPRLAYGKQIDNQEVKKLIKQFLIEYKGNIVYHNGNFDMKVLIYELWMKNLGDYKGMLNGIDVLGSKFDDTKIITYLAINNTVDTTLSLKSLSQDFAGNYAQEDIKDIRLIPDTQLLQYNLIDCLSTWYVRNKYTPIMIQEEQQEIYLTLFKPSITLLLQIELVGMPINPKQVQKAKAELEKIVAKHSTYLLNSHIIKDYHYTQLMQRVDRDNAKLKTKKRTIEDFAHIKFNPNSDTQVTGLIYDYLGYPVLDKTSSGGPACGSKTLAKLINHARSDEHKEIFSHLIGLAKANKILTSFIPAFENNTCRLPDGSYRLYGNFNLGGTQSGRLSSSDPNLQNIPSGSEYAKIIKMCFISPPGWLFGGADFSALEAMVGALLPKDPNKLKIYKDGYDSHCLHAFAYFANQMPDIEDTVVSINSIKKKYKPLRSKSKAPTFALQYFGTWRTVMNSAGVSEAEAKDIEVKFKDFYAVSIRWINKVLDDAHTTGYIEGAFGLKIRTPILAKTPLGKRMHYAAEAERRSAGNAKTQSYGLLNNRAAIEFRDRVLKSPYKYDVFLVSLIHDATYILCRNNPAIVKWVNDNLIECMRWQELPELQDDEVKLGAELDLYWPTWADGLTLPNNIPVDDIKQRAAKHKRKLELKWFNTKPMMAFPLLRSVQ